MLRERRVNLSEHSTIVVPEQVSARQGPAPENLMHARLAKNTTILSKGYAKVKEISYFSFFSRSTAPLPYL